MDKIQEKENKLELIAGRYHYNDALAVATDIMEQLRPHCFRIEIAGSIRRKSALVGDIEIVAIPKPYATGLFEDGIASIVNRWEKVKGKLVYGKSRYTQRILPGGIKLDLFLATPENWGQTFAVRTGSAEYSHKILAIGWCKRGFESVDGYLMKGGKRYEVREERDLFELIGIPYVDPEMRNLEPTL